MTTTYAILDPVSGQYQYANTKFEALGKMANIAVNFYINQNFEFIQNTENSNTDSNVLYFKFNKI
jgi:hypothetical protein